MMIKAGFTYCGEHASSDTSNEFRIPCPNDPNHSVDKRHLEAHLSKCNGRLPEEVYVSRNVNLTVPEAETDELSQPDPTDFVKVLNIVEAEYARIKDDISVEHETNEFVEGSDVAKPKHRRQISSIVGQMSKSGLLSDKSGLAVMELGVGRGQLAYFMANAAPKADFILLDYSGVKHKADGKISADTKVTRIRCPVEHVDVTKIEPLHAATSISFTCKHFCGSATDYGINLINRALNAKLPVAGFALAPCCHHRIEPRQYTGFKYLKSLGIDTNEFIVMRQMATWATCGERPNMTSPMESNDDGDDFKLWSYVKKRDIGRKCKALIETGRLKHLQQLGFNVRLLEYVDVDVSPENLMIVGVRI
uniref:tRNA:m(4)X modification enzyme TRM13 n=1 Tax=Panagrellus redivivus TaxID=6233 RepID=A0A7E4VID9_PANRE